MKKITLLQSEKIIEFPDFISRRQRDEIFASVGEKRETENSTTYGGRIIQSALVAIGAGITVDEYLDLPAEDSDLIDEAVVAMITPKKKLSGE